MRIKVLNLIKTVKRREREKDLPEGIMTEIEKMLVIYSYVTFCGLNFYFIKNSYFVTTIKSMFVCWETSNTLYPFVHLCFCCCFKPHRGIYLLITECSGTIA